MKQLYSHLQIIAAAALLIAAGSASAQAPSLGTAASFGVLGGSTVTNTGPTVVIGDLGVSPGTAITGFPPGVVNGTIHVNDAVAQQAQNDVTTAYNALAALPCGTVLTGQDLGGLTLTPGVYCFATSAQLTGTLTLNAQGNPAAQFIFQIGSTLTTASNSRVMLINGGQSCNVYWQVGSSATIGTASAFAGNILALASITSTTGASVSGRLLARNGAVTLDSSSVAGCSGCSAIVLAPATLPDGVLGVVYNQVITASGGTAPYTFTVIAGALPPGLTLSNTGNLTGIPTTPGSFSFTVRATDSVGCPGTRIYTLIVNPVGCPTITISPATIPAANAGTPYGPVTLTASGGTAPYTFSITAGALPAGVTLSPSGVISGTPTQSGSFTVTITATDAASCRGSRIYSAIVNCPVIIISPATIPSAVSGAPYALALTASGGTAPYTFARTSGALPPGLTLSPTGLISGIATTTGNFNFSVTVTDATGCQGVRSYTMAVAQAVGAVGGPTLDEYGLTILVVLLAVAGAFIVNRMSV